MNNIGFVLFLNDCYLFDVYVCLNQERCSPGEDVTTMTVVIDNDYTSLSIGNKISLLTNLARYFAMSSVSRL